MTTQTPQVVPSAASRAWDPGADWRVSARDGQLVLSRSEGEEVVAAVVRATVAPGGATGLSEHHCLVLITGTEALAFPLGSWLPGQLGPTGGGHRLDIPDALRLSGFDGVLEALHLNVDDEPLPAGVTVRVLDPLQRTDLLGSPPAVDRISRPVLFLGGGLGVLVAPAGIAQVFGLEWPIEVWGAVAVLIMVPVLAVIARAQFAAAARMSVPVSDDAVAGLPHPVQIAALPDGTLVTVDPSGVQASVPSSVTRAAIYYGALPRDAAIELQLDPAEGGRAVSALVVEPAWWRHDEATTARVLAWLAAHGVHCQEIRQPRSSGLELDPWEAAEGAGLTWSEPLLQQASAATLLAAAPFAVLASAYRSGFWLVVAVVVGARLSLTLARRRDTRR